MALSKNGPVVFWKSKKQQTVALSCEAEYMALSATTQESLYLTNLINGMDNVLEYAQVNMFGDNQSAIALSKKKFWKKWLYVKYTSATAIYSISKQEMLGKIMHNTLTGLLGYAGKLLATSPIARRKKWPRACHGDKMGFHSENDSKNPGAAKWVFQGSL